MKAVLYSQAWEGKESRMHVALIFEVLLRHPDHTQVSMVSITCASPQVNVVSISPYNYMVREPGLESQSPEKVLTFLSLMPY